jgi:hypothetical protein
LAEEPRLTDEELKFAKILSDIVWRDWELKHLTPKRELLIKPQLERVAVYFLTECKKREVDPEAVDFRKEIAAVPMTEKELKDKVREVLDRYAVKPPEALEIAPEEAYRVIEGLGKKVVEMKDYELIERASELKDKLERERKNVKLLKDMLESKKKYIEELERRIAGVPTPLPKELSEEEKKRLEDVFKATLYRELGRVPRDAMSEFRVEFETVKVYPYEEALKVIERLAKDIADRERAGRVVPVAPAPPEEVAPPAAPTVPREVVKPPAVPLDLMAFPRRLSSAEINAFWRAFESELASVGLRTEEFMEYWIRFRDAWHQDWFHVLRAFKEMIDDIKAWKEPRYYPRTLTPVWKNLPRDAILHLLATKVPQSMDDLIAQLNMHGVYVMPQQVTLIVKEEWKKTPRDSWLEVTPRDYLKKILGADPEDP